MYNWSVDERELKKNPEKYEIWRLEQMINYGLQGKKLDSRLLKKNWKKMFMDKPTRRYLSYLLWPNRRKY